MNLPLVPLLPPPRGVFTGTVERTEGVLEAHDPYTGARVPLDDDGEAPREAGTVATFHVDVDAGRARIFERLARGGSARAAMYRIAAHHKLDPTFPPEVMREVDAITRAPGIQSGVDSGELADMRDKAFITIDNADSRDLDQAMYIERTPGDGHIVHYALADASYYVKPGSKLWDEALERKTSFYLPGLAIPMLPRPLSEDLVSLNENVDRRALVFSLTLDEEGQLLGAVCERACIRSRKKLAYDRVQAYHNDIAAGVAASNAEHHGHDFTETLVLLGEVGQRRMALARTKDVPSFSRTPLHVSYKDEAGYTFTLVSDKRNAVEKWNEQISLLCNTEGAALLLGLHDDHDVQPVFRNHDAPPVARMRAFADFLEALVQERGLDLAVFRWRRDESLADYLARLPEGPEFERVVTAIHQKAIYTNVGAAFEAMATGHFGVGTTEGYARFSSPMREVVGIFTHKELLDGLLGASSTPQTDEALRTDVLAAANAASKLQNQITKEANKLAIDALFKGDLAQPEQERPVRRGTLMDVSGSQALFRLDEPPIEVKIYREGVAAFTGRALKAAGAVTVREGDQTWYVGDGVDLQVVGYDDAKGHWMIVPVRSAASPKGQAE